MPLFSPHHVMWLSRLGVLVVVLGLPQCSPHHPAPAPPQPPAVNTPPPLTPEEQQKQLELFNRFTDQG
jgi:hypothetical protein